METSFCKKTKLVRLDEDQAIKSLNVATQNSMVLNDELASELMVKNADEDHNKVACTTGMLDVSWIFGENADKQARIYGDLMVIVDDAP